MPNVTWAGEHGSTAMARYDIICLHTIVGRDPAHAAHFSVGSAGEITQSRDTRYRSAANLNGNHRVLAIETEDRGPGFPDWNVNDGHAVPAWTGEQCKAIARILVWAHQTHDIPLTLAPNSRPTSRGVAYHRMGCDGNYTGYAYGGRVVGGELWSSARGKVCPGDRRIKQLIEVILPMARVLAGLDKPDIMAIDFNQRIGKDSSVEEQFIGYPSGTLGHWFRGIRQYVQGTRSIVTSMASVVDTILARLGNARTEISVVNTSVQEALSDLDRVELALARVEGKLDALATPVSEEIDYDRIIDGLFDKMIARLQN